MGSGGSNLSRTDLDVYQSSITDISQSIRAEASNLSKQSLNKTQKIKLQVGESVAGLINPCELRQPSIEACIQNNCSKLNQDPIYQCRIKQGDFIGPTSVEACDQAFGVTFDYAENDPQDICSGTGTAVDDLTVDAQREKCRDMALRLSCKPNDLGTFLSYPVSPISGTTIPCPSGTDVTCPAGTECDTSKGICGVRSIPGTTDPACGGGCGIKMIYMAEEITQDGKRKFTYNHPLTLQELNDAGYTQHCSFFEPQNPGEKCYSTYNTDLYFDCSQVPNTGGPYIGDNADGFADAFAKCSKACDTSIGCTNFEVETYKPEQGTLIVNGGMCLENVSGTTFVSEQIAESNVTAQMITFLSNDLQSEITKTITQANEGINFGQENNSQERTSITQKIKTEISQAIAANAHNSSLQGSDIEQDIEQIIYGTVIVAGNDQQCETEKTQSGHVNTTCVMAEGPQSGDQNTNCVGGNAFAMSNSSVDSFSTKQESRSIIDAIMNSTVLNTIKSDYDFTLTQTNKNDLLGFLWLIIIGIIIIGAILSYALTKSIDVLKILAIVAGVLVVIVGIVFIVMWAVDAESFNKMIGIEKVSDQNPSGSVTQEVESDVNSDKPSNFEVECPIDNMANCNCSYFIKQDIDLCTISAADRDQLTNLTCKDLNVFETTVGAPLDQQCQQLVNRRVRWGDVHGPVTMDLCTELACVQRNFVDPGGTGRMVCKVRTGTTEAPVERCPVAVPTV